MCGIIGYLGKRQALPIIVGGLRRLEYRGYDSAGVVVFSKDGIPQVTKAKGGVDNLTKKISDKKVSGFYGIGHVRWATNGEPSVANAHPHWDCHKKVFVVHNGVVENNRALKEALKEKGHSFSSETDSEVFAHLIEEYFHGNLEDAVRLALEKIKGTYAIAVISLLDSRKIIFACQSSPLLIGQGKEETFISSDVSAILGHTKQIIYLNDNEMGIVTPEGVSIFDANHQPVLKKTQTIGWNIKEAEKSGYPHFMLKEIMEGPEVIRRAIRGRIVLDEGLSKLGGIEKYSLTLKKAERLIIIGMGTALIAAKIAAYAIEEHVGIIVQAENASEFRYRSPVIRKSDIVLAVSQSGETADTLFAVREAKRKGALTLGIINVVGSTIAREVDVGIYNHAGPEIGVAATKSFVSQLTVFVLLMVFLGRNREMSLGEGKRILRGLTELPGLAEKILSQRATIKKVAQKYSSARDFLFLGRKYNYPLALEGALKLKEISYIHAEGLEAGAIKHGPIAMIDLEFPSLMIIPKDSVYEKTLLAIEEIKARHGKVIAITSEDNKDLKKKVDDILYLPLVEEILWPILGVIPLQLFAYYIGVEKGFNVDKPRNLAKSVTVE